MSRFAKITSKLMVATCVLAAMAGLVAFLAASHPTRQFDSTVSSIASDPDAWIERQMSFSTYPPEQPIFGKSITSKDINAHIVEAYEYLSSRLNPTPITYYSESGDMPTQETIWQYPTHFVRLYVTSSLDSDGAAIGVFSGAYKDFRKERLIESAEPYFRLVPMAFQAPERFLADR